MSIPSVWLQLWWTQSVKAECRSSTKHHLNLFSSNARARVHTFISILRLLFVQLYFLLCETNVQTIHWARQLCVVELHWSAIFTPYPIECIQFWCMHTHYLAMDSARCKHNTPRDCGKYSWMQTMIIIVVNFCSKSRLFFALFVIYCRVVAAVAANFYCFSFSSIIFSFVHLRLGCFFGYSSLLFWLHNHLEMLENNRTTIVLDTLAIAMLQRQDFCVVHTFGLSNFVLLYDKIVVVVLYAAHGKTIVKHRTFFLYFFCRFRIVQQMIIATVIMLLLISDRPCTLK